MPLHYHKIEIFTSEDARWKGKPLSSALVTHVNSAQIAARCIVYKGLGGCYENGELASTKIEILSLDMPLKIEILVPSSELDKVLPGIEEIVTEGIIVVRDIEILSYKSRKW